MNRILNVMLVEPHMPKNNQNDFITFEVEVYIVTGSGICETIVVDVECKDEKDALSKMTIALNSPKVFVGIGTGVFQKENVRGTCIIRKKKRRK
jgi:hypothetical protein